MGKLPARIKLLSSQIVFNSPYIAVRADKVIENKLSKTYYVVAAVKLVALVVINADQVLLVKQYRYAVNKQLLGLPGGRVEAGETFLQAARRELEEETDIKAIALKPLTEVYLDPGQSAKRVRVYLARVKSGVTSNKQFDPEINTTCWYELATLKAMLLADEIKDPVAAIALVKLLIE